MKKLLISISIAGMLFSCKNSSDSKMPECDTAAILEAKGVNAPEAVAAALPDNAFYCLRAGADTVERWLDLETGRDKYKRMVFNYYWPDRNQNPFTLIGFRTKKNDRKFDPTPYTLTRITTCTVTGIETGTDIILSDQQVSIDEIRRLWGFRTGAGPHYLKFTPMINYGKDHEGNPCNCPRYLTYKIDLVTTGGIPGADYTPGATNPSPPKPPADF